MTARYGKLFGAMDKAVESRRKSSESGTVANIPKGSPKGGPAVAPARPSSRMNQVLMLNLAAVKDHGQPRSQRPSRTEKQSRSQRPSQTQSETTRTYADACTRANPQQSGYSLSASRATEPTSRTSRASRATEPGSQATILPSPRVAFRDVTFRDNFDDVASTRAGSTITGVSRGESFASWRASSDTSADCTPLAAHAAAHFSVGSQFASLRPDIVNSVGGGGKTGKSQCAISMASSTASTAGSGCRTPKPASRLMALTKSGGCVNTKPASEDRALAAQYVVEQLRAQKAKRSSFEQKNGEKANNSNGGSIVSRKTSTSGISTPRGSAPSGNANSTSRLSSAALACAAMGNLRARGAKIQRKRTVSETSTDYTRGDSSPVAV